MKKYLKIIIFLSFLVSLQACETMSKKPGSVHGDKPLIDSSKIIEEIIAPLSFYRGVIKSKAKSLNLIHDDTTYDLLMDLSFTLSESPLGEIEKSIDELDGSTSLFFDFLVSSNSQYSIDDMLLDKELIPSRSEIEDPISWAARTSLPPI